MENGTIDLLVLELTIAVGILGIFIIGYSINNFLRKRNLDGFTKVINSFCVVFSTKLMKKMEEKDKDLHEVNKVLQESLKETLEEKKNETH